MLQHLHQISDKICIRYNMKDFYRSPFQPAKEEKQAVHQNGHSIQALLSSSNIVSSTSESKAVYSIPTYLQAVHNTDGNILIFLLLSRRRG